jgi:hypothetical protein
MSTYDSGSDRTPARRAAPVLLGLGLLLVIGWLLVAIDRQGESQSQAGAAAAPGPSILSIPKANRPLLRVITCTGSFDHATGHYRDNLILYASPTGS